MKEIKNTIIIGTLVALFFLTTYIDKRVLIIEEKTTTIENKIDSIIEIEQTQLDIDTSDFSELNKAIERLNCYEDFIKVINDEPSKDPHYSMMMKVKLLQLILNESRTVGNIELSICEEQQNKMDKINDQMTNIVNQEFSKNE